MSRAVETFQTGSETRCVRAESMAERRERTWNLEGGSEREKMSIKSISILQNCMVLSVCIPIHEIHM